MRVQACSAAELRAFTGDDAFVRSQSRYRFGPAWRSAGAVAFVSLDPDGNIRHLAAVGTPKAAAGLVAAAIHEVPSVPRLSLPRGTPGHLPDWLRLHERADWDFRWTRRPPPASPGEDRAGWLGRAEEPEVADLLSAANPETSARPGDPRVRRWAGIRAGCASGRLDGCLADTSGAR